MQALEKALLVFHSNKMAEINKVVKELWQKTYRNRDIDCIQIKADADGAKSYAYRVVMQAGGAELEMRGRCSAGQKVFSCPLTAPALLASLGGCGPPLQSCGVWKHSLISPFLQAWKSQPKCHRIPPFLWILTGSL